MSSRGVISGTKVGSYLDLKRGPKMGPFWVPKVVYEQRTPLKTPVLAWYLGPPKGWIWGELRVFGLMR